MQVFGLPGHVIRNAARASRLLSSPGAETARRADLVRRWRRACRDGLTVEQAARAVGVPLSTLRRWEKRPERLSTRPLRCRRPELRRGLEGRVRELRKRFPAWGRGKIAAVLRREGIRVSDATVGRAIRDLVRRGRMAPVSAFTAHSRRSRRSRRPHAVRTRRPGSRTARRPAPRTARGTANPPRAAGRTARAGGPGRHAHRVAAAPGRTVRHFTAVDRLSRWGCGMAASNATAASAARFLDKLVRQAPFSVEAVQVDGGSEFMAEFEAACGDRNITLAVLPPKSPKQNGRVERMQATLRNEFYNVQDTAVNVSGLRPLIDEYMELYNGWRPHDSLDGMTPDEYLESRRIGETPPLHMS